MAVTIFPAVSGTQKRWAAHSMVFFLGALIGCLGAVMVTLAVFGALDLFASREMLGFVAVAVGASAIARDFGFQTPVPYLHRQVPERWRREFPLGVTSFAYGLVLGAGFPTLFTASTQLTFLLGVPFIADPLVIVAAPVLFAAGKTVPLLLGLGTSSEEDVFSRVQTSDVATPARLVARRVASATVSALILASLVGVTVGW